MRAAFAILAVAALAGCAAAPTEPARRTISAPDFVTLDAQDAIDLPLYGIDHNQFKFVVLDGDYMRRSEPRIKDGSHNTYEWFIDLTANLRLFQRRSCFLLYNAAGAA